MTERSRPPMLDDKQPDTTSDYPKPDPAFDHSRYASLNCRAISDEAKALIDQLSSVVEDQEIESGKRKNRRREKTTRKQWQAVESFAGDLLFAATKAKAEGWCYRSLKAENFTNERVTYRAFTSLLKALEGLGYVEHIKGQQRVQKVGFADGYIASKGKASRFRVTEGFLKLAEINGIFRDEVRHHFIQGLPQHPLVLKENSKRINGDKLSGKAMKFVHTPKSLELESEVRELNEFLDDFDIRGAVHKGYRRIFNKGDISGFDWNRGGRLYGGEDSYQRQPKEVRLQMTINGSPVVEIDISASYLTILHGLQGIPFDPSARDPYDIDGVDRSVVKVWATATLGNDRHLRRWPQKAVEDFEEKTRQRLPDIITVTALRALMEQRHPIFTTWNDSPLTWADLMFCESKAMVGTMLELMSNGLPSLCVHDSIIVRTDDQHTALVALGRQFKAASGIEAVVKINVPTPALDNSTGLAS